MFRHSWVCSSLDLLPALLARAASSSGGVTLLHAAFFETEPRGEQQEGMQRCNLVKEKYRAKIDKLSKTIWHFLLFCLWDISTGLCTLQQFLVVIKSQQGKDGH